MKPAFVRLGALVGATVVLSLAACGPSDVVGKAKLDKVKEGAKLSELSGLLGTGPLTPMQPADSMRLFNGYRTQVFMAKGQMYRVVWVRDEPGSIEDAITREKESPILLVGDSVIGKGWAFFDKTANDVGLPNPYREKEHLDSMARAAKGN